MIDFNLTNTSGTINRDIDLLKQQIDMLFDTNPGDVLGDETFGTRYDEYLYDLQLSNEGLKQEVLADLRSLELFDFTPTVNVYLLEGTERDIALINIVLSRGGVNIEKNYKIV